MENTRRRRGRPHPGGRVAFLADFGVSPGSRSMKTHCRPSSSPIQLAKVFKVLTAARSPQAFLLSKCSGAPAQLVKEFPRHLWQCRALGTKAKRL